jgi:peptidoglycan/xylan/chitin deacetylase (PgdA/CDA1 family)
MPSLVVLMYHRVAPEAAGRLAHLTVPPDRFAWQMAKLREGGFAPQRQDDVAAWLAGRRDLPRRAVVITFDDGYADNAVHAFPILERYRIPGVTFVVTGKLGGSNDWDEGAASWPLMDAPAVQYWAQRGLEFGAHGRRHRSLVGLDEAALAEEIDGSHADLSTLLGQPPIAFAYPYGDEDAPSRSAAARRYRLAYGTREGGNNSRGDAWSLRRTSVLPAYPGYEFLCQLRLGWGPRDRLRSAALHLRRGLQVA